MSAVVLEPEGIASFPTAPCEKLKWIKGVAYPETVHFGQIIVTGPPGAGKSLLVRRLGGWFEEGFLDLSFPRWWAHPLLHLRPREVHLGAPFSGFDKSMGVFEQAWVNARDEPQLLFDKILLPPRKRFFLSVDWRARYVFDFLLPQAEALLAWRQERSHRKTHLVDGDLSLQQVEWQLDVYWQLAAFLHRQGVKVIVRQTVDEVPRRFLLPQI